VLVVAGLVEDVCAFDVLVLLLLRLLLLLDTAAKGRK